MVLAMASYQSVDDYIAAQPASARDVLQRVRNVLRQAVPAAEEAISYQIPAYQLNGERIIYFAGWKQHYSLYPATRTLLAEFKDDLAPYEVRQSTLRFRLSEPVPAKLIERIAKFRAQEVAGKTLVAAKVKKSLKPKAGAKAKTSVKSRASSRKKR